MSVLASRTSSPSDQQRADDDASLAVKPPADDAPAVAVAAQADSPSLCAALAAFCMRFSSAACSESDGNAEAEAVDGPLELQPVLGCSMTSGGISLKDTLLRGPLFD